MADDVGLLAEWLEESSKRQRHFAGTFWFVFSQLPPALLGRHLQLESMSDGVPLADMRAIVTTPTRKKPDRETVFWHLPFNRPRINFLFTLAKPSAALRPVYTLLSRAREAAQLFPLGHGLIESCVRLSKRHSFEETRVKKGVSYPSKQNEGGADINLLPGNARHFFARVEQEQRVLKTVRLRAPTVSGFCEYTVSRLGFVSYHEGEARPLLELIVSKLPEAMCASARPFEQAKGKFVSLRFSEAIFTSTGSYRPVLAALGRLPRATVALLHANPYFHAVVTNYEDGGEFDVFITHPSRIDIQGRGETSPTSFLRLRNTLADMARDSTVALDVPRDLRLADLIAGRA